MTWPPTCYPRSLSNDANNLCGVCCQYPCARGDWMCTKCRREAEASWQRIRRELAEAFAQALASREAQTQTD